MVFLLPLTLAVVSCASWNCIGGPYSPSFPQVRYGQWPEREQVFRHAVRIDLSRPHPPFSFDGIMRLRHGAADPEIRVVCLGALGLTLCDMTITPNGHRTDLLHPSLARMPHVAEHIALCIKSIWFVSLPLTEQGEKAVARREIHGRTLLEHMAEEGGRVVKASGPDASWTVGYIPGVPQPPRIIFHNECEGYTVTIRLVAG